MNQLHLTLEVAPTAQCSELDPAIHDEALVQKAQAGDPESIDCLLCMYLPDFRRHARCACGGDLAAAEDVCQEACLKAIYALDRFVAGRSFRAWVFAFINNEARNWKSNLKKDCTRTQKIDIHIIETMSASADNNSEADEREILRFLSERAAQLALPQRPSAIFMLAHYERLHEFPTIRAIAQATHCSQGAAQLYRRANLASWRHLLTASQGAVL